MAFLDRFRTNAPARTPRGESGRGHVDGYLHLEELNRDLAGTRGLQVFDDMYRSDPDIRRVVGMVINPIVGATFTVEPAGGDDAEEKDRKAAELVEYALMKHMRPKLAGHLSTALPVVIRSGFAPFEQVWGVEQWEGREVLLPKSLQLRLPRTIQQFHQDDAGELTELVQWTLKKARVSLPADDLVFYRVGAEGDNWEGTSLLRPVYKPWFLKDKIERIDAIAQEREATGIPIAYPPANADDDVLDHVEQVLAHVRVNEQGYIVAPGPKAEYSEKGEGWIFEILSHKSSEQRSSKPSLDYHTNKIAAAFIAEFMRLGQDGVGARATADVQQDPFLAAVDALATAAVLDPLNEQLVSRIVALNLDVEEPPKLKMSLVDSTSLEELASFVGTLVEKGALKPDDELEDFLRKRGKLPAADAKAREERKKRAEQMPSPTDPPAPTDPPEPQRTAPTKPPTPAVPARDRDRDPVVHRWGRELRWWEKHMALEEIDSAITNARQRFEQGAGDDAREVARAFATAAIGGRSVMPKPAPELEEAIAAELEVLYRIGRATVARELDTQRTDTSVQTPEPIDDADKIADLRRRAKLAAQSIAARVWQAVSREAIARPGDVAAIQAAGEAEAAAALRGEAQLHSAGALNQGRVDAASQYADEISGSRYTSILDTNRCGACATADDDVLRPLDDPVRLSRVPPNPACEGGGRCRCLEFYELKEEGGGYGGPPPPSPVDPVSPSVSVAEHFDITGGNAAVRELVAEQVAAIQSVHAFPASMPRIPIKISGSMSSAYGRFSVWVSQTTGRPVKAEITLSRVALERNPPITSTVHEIGHFLDAYGLGQGVPAQAMAAKNYLSGTDALVAWREAVTKSNAYKQLVLGGGTTYQTSIKELWARSYEQWIALRAGNARLRAKIAARRIEETPHLYWDDDDFREIAAAFDQAFGTRGLRS